MIIPTTEPPRYALDVSDVAGGRRLLSDEVSLLEHVGYALGRRLDAIRLERERLARRLKEEEISRREAEARLEALRAQINPHFLFNTLTTIGYLVQTSPTEAVRTLLRLTEVLRRVLRSDEHVAPLDLELRLVKAYLEIERARFEERLDTRIDVPPDLLPALVPPLILQPLVENAVKHGVSSRAAGGIVIVSGRRITGLDGVTSLELTVRDQARGAEPSVETDIGSGDRPHEHRAAAGAGLRRAGVGLARGAPRWRHCARPAASGAAGGRAGALRGGRHGVIVDQLRAVIADDERPARAFLRSALRKRPDVEIVGEAAEGIAAVRLIEEQRPDVAFLDLQMPGLDGLGVVRMLDRRHLPFVVFVTAYVEHAVKAFEVNAVDYLLKPVSPERLAETLTRVHERLDRTDQRAAAAAGLQRAVDAVEPVTGSGYLERIPCAVRTRSRLCRSNSWRPSSPRESWCI